MRCIIVDHRDDFASILIDKLGTGFALAGTSIKDCAKDCDVIMVAVPPAGDPAFAEQSAALSKAALNAGGVPVVALVPGKGRV